MIQRTIIIARHLNRRCTARLRTKGSLLLLLLVGRIRLMKWKPLLVGVLKNLNLITAIAFLFDSFKAKRRINKFLKRELKLKQKNLLQILLQTINKTKILLMWSINELNSYLDKASKDAT